MRAHRQTFAQNVVLEILILERKTVVWVVVGMLPFLIAKSLMVKTHQKAARMSGNQVIDIICVAVNVPAKIIDLDVGVPVFLGECRCREE